MIAYLFKVITSLVVYGLSAMAQWLLGTHEGVDLSGIHAQALHEWHRTWW